MRLQVDKSQSSTYLADFKQCAFQHFGIYLIIRKCTIKLSFCRQQFVADSYCLRLHFVESDLVCAT